MKNELKSIKRVIFDLDGTLIDSASSILFSMQFAFEKVGLVPVRPLLSDLIGPPLTETIRSLLNVDSLGFLPEIVNIYKCHYDEVGYKESRPYEGVPSMLNELRDKGFSLYIATNKRIIPTRKIIGYLGWNSVFDELYSLDYFEPPLQNKTTLLKRVHEEVLGFPEETIYLGDRTSDAEAAITNGVCFLGASWGYGGSFYGDGFSVNVKSPGDVAVFIDNNLQQLNR